MRVKIWGARGSIPSPIRPEEIREKIISAMLRISSIDNDELREELITVILEKPQHSATTISQSKNFKTDDVVQAQRRKVIENYLDHLSLLAARTAGGNTSCIEIQSRDNLVIIDAGSGIRELGLELMKGSWGKGHGEIHLLFSHPHWDHIQGFPFFRPAFVPGNKIFIYSVHDMEFALRQQQANPSFPVSLDDMQAHLEFIRLEPEKAFDIGDLRIRTIANHHPGVSYAFRVEKEHKTFVYASDASYPEGMDRRPHLDFFKEADVLIYDAQFTQRESDEKEDWGHSSSFVGIEMAQAARVKTLVLFHYDPTYSDEELEKILEDAQKFQENQYPAENHLNIIIAQEGQTFDLTPPQTIQLQQIPGSNITILKLAGVFDERVTVELREKLGELATGGEPTQLIVDLSHIEMLQMAGLRALVKLRKEQQGASMVLVGPSIKVQQVIELAGYLDFFAIYPSVHAALSRLQARETLNLPGQMIKNRYYIEEKIGDGRLGMVFKASDTRLNRPVAIKILSSSFSAGAIEQFLNQARQIIDLIHPNIVDIFDCDEEHGLSFMAEEFVEGKTLQEMIDENPGQPFPFEVALSITENIARALEYAHAHGVIHGDLKPKNVLIADKIKISDFGLGRLESGKSLLNLDVPLALVTARYLAPEQVLGHPIDARTDLYALGVILYELFTGQPPFDGSDHEILEHHRSSLPRPPRELNPRLSPVLEHLILKLLDKDPTKRYATARQTQRILASMAVTTRGKARHDVFTRQQRPFFVGRAEVMEQLLGRWAETQYGKGQLVFIRGEAGIGKTRLVQELAQRTGQATRLIGSCRTLTGDQAYEPFIQALTAYFATTPPEIAQKQVGDVLNEAGEVIPEIQQLMPNVMLPKTRKPNSVKNRARQGFSLAKLIEQATKEQPWLLILDDLHWADPGSLQLLSYLARNCESMALMIVGIYQSSDVEDNKFLAEIVSQLKYQATHIALEPLKDEEVKGLLENIWSQQPVPADLISAIHRRTEGNPFYIIQVANGLIDEGVVSWRDGKWRFTPIVEVDLPQTIKEAILRCINRLSKKTKNLLHQAAVLGYTFKFDELREMSNFPEWDTLENLDIALERQLIKEIPGEGVLHFSHIQIQQVLYESLTPLKRQPMHRKAGEALEHLYQPESKLIAAKLAHHFLQAGELEKGLIYSIQAATQARAIHANHMALTWYTQALDAPEQLGLGNVTQPQRFEMLLARERIYDNLGERQAQAADLTALQSLAQALDDPVKQARVHERQAHYEREIGRLAEAALEAQAGLIAARQANHPILEGKSLIQSAYIAFNQDRFETALEAMRTAQKILKETGDRNSEAMSLNGLGVIYSYLNDYSQAESYYQQALTMYQATGHWSGQAVCLANLGNLHQEAGNYTRAKSCYQQALEINRMIGHQQGEAACLNHIELANQLEQAQNKETFD